MSEHEHDIIVASKRGVLELRFNRPEKKNAITNAMYGALADAMEAAAADAEVRAILFTAAGDFFTAGNDIVDFAAIATGAGGRRPAPCRALPGGGIRAEKPLVAAVQGHAVGVGVTMLFHCDLVYVAETRQADHAVRRSGRCSGERVQHHHARAHGPRARVCHAGPWASRCSAATRSPRASPTRRCRRAKSKPRARAAAQALAEKPAESLRLTKALMRDRDAAARAHARGKRAVRRAPAIGGSARRLRGVFVAGLSLLLFTHPAMLAHEPPRGHAERPERLAAVLEGLAELKLGRREAPLAEVAAIARAHPGGYVAALERAFAEARGTIVQLDPDTFLSAGTREAAYRAAGACVAAVDAVLGDEDDMAFCAVRPPGHHAEPNAPMGFCIFNNVAIGALHALHAHGLSKVAVVDFDVHHGNGTQTIAEREARLMFVSTHQAPLYPGTGLAEEHGLAGNVVNAPLPAGAGGAEWRVAMERVILPALEDFRPNLLLVSAGFDAHRADPLAQMRLENQDFAWAGARLRAFALRHCKAKLVASLEGGYDLAALAGSAKAFVAALMRD